MNFSNLSKEQKQYVFLGVVIGIGALYSLVTFGVKPFIDRWGQTKEEYEQLQEDLAEASEKVNRTSRVLLELDSTYTNLVNLADQYIPPSQNALSWVTQRIYKHARRLGLGVESIDEQTVEPPWMDIPGGERFFTLYSVRLSTQTGYNKLREFIQEVHASNPLVMIGDISVDGLGEKRPEQHRVSVLIQWPWWGELDREELLMNSSSESLTPQAKEPS